MMYCNYTSVSCGTLIRLLCATTFCQNCVFVEFLEVLLNQIVSLFLVKLETRPIFLSFLVLCHSVTDLQ